MWSFIVTYNFVGSLTKVWGHYHYCVTSAVLQVILLYLFTKVKPKGLAKIVVNMVHDLHLLVI